MKWPVVYVCENNFYAATTHVSVNCPLENIADRAAAYGIPGVVANGNDVLAVRETAQAAVSRARSGEGPTLIECKTYRHKPHCMVIPEHRPRKEMKEWLSEDPILMLSGKLIAQGYATEAELKAIENRELELLDEAVSFMQNSAFPDPATVGNCLWA
jgi:pyruvate dehydrogenase E1 component alpha subunit